MNKIELYNTHSYFIVSYFSVMIVFKGSIIYSESTHNMHVLGRNNDATLYVALFRNVLMQELILKSNISGLLSGHK